MFQTACAGLPVWLGSRMVFPVRSPVAIMQALFILENVKCLLSQQIPNRANLQVVVAVPGHVTTTHDVFCRFLAKKPI